MTTSLFYVIVFLDSLGEAEKEKGEDIMDTALSSYDMRIAQANPLYADTTQDGKKLTQQESAFIHHYIQLGNATQAFLKAGFTFPRRKRTKEERESGISDMTRAESYNELYRQNDLHHGTAEKRKAEVLEILNKEYNLIEDINPIVDKVLKDEEEDTDESAYLLQVAHSASHLLHMPSVQREIASRLEAIRSAQIADEHEVLAYFTAVMRGQVLDQFGLEAPLQERTRAAECLAKRLIDMPKKLQASGTINGQNINLVIERRSEEDDIIDME